MTALELDGRWLLISGAADGLVHICDVWSRELIATIDYLPGPIDQLEASPEGYLLIVARGELTCGRLRL